MLPTMETEQLLNKHGRRERMMPSYEAAIFLQKDKVILGVRVTLPPRDSAMFPVLQQAREK